MKGERHETHTGNDRSLNSHGYIGLGFRGSGDGRNESFRYPLPGIWLFDYSVPTGAGGGLVLLHSQDALRQYSEENCTGNRQINRNIITEIEKENIMKNLTLTRKLALGMMLVCGDATTTWAAGSAREDNSDLFVWIFLAFCALIVVAQLIPAAMMLMGFAKGAKKTAPEAVPVMADRETRLDG